MEAEQTRIAVMSIIVEDRESAEPLNRLLHNYGNYIIGRMGLPYEKKKLSLMSVALDAPENTISELAGKVGNLPNISVKTAYAKR
ncbi:TM1266 family iron-only hydrogenase system putative regulator [Stomatobaculum longum]|uniref:TM1266 family iron-only hydrogenase system putative regulator n=1 Tax=Stomatobaculum longum TaxID=796942 RepID=UPI0028E4AF11|nr:TM1266 family iron-only hydrogenase system putative regulator [Stomatobaculum longum]